MGDNEETVTIPKRLLRDLRSCIHDCMDGDGDVFDEATEYLDNPIEDKREG